MTFLSRVRTRTLEFGINLKRFFTQGIKCETDWRTVIDVMTHKLWF